MIGLCRYIKASVASHLVLMVSNTTLGAMDVSGYYQISIATCDRIRGVVNALEPPWVWNTECARMR